MDGGSPSMRPGLASLAPAVGAAAVAAGAAAVAAADTVAAAAAMVVVAVDTAAVVVAEAAGPAAVTADIDRENREITSMIAASLYQLARGDLPFEGRGSTFGLILGGRERPEDREHRVEVRQTRTETIDEIAQ